MPLDDHYYRNNAADYCNNGCKLLSSSDMDGECNLSTELHNSLLLQSFRWIHICVSICSIALVLYICLHHLSRTILDRVSIIIAKTVYLNILAYSFGFGVVQIVKVAHAFARLAAVTPCDAQIPNVGPVHRHLTLPYQVLCLFRMMATSISTAFVLLHVSFTIQQALSSFRFSVKVQCIVATLCIFFTYFYATCYGYFVFHDETLTGTTQFCSSFTPIRVDIIIINLNIMITLDIIKFIFTILLVTYNKKILKNERNSFDLSRTFQRMQNVYTMEPFIPVFSLHSIVHSVHVVLYSVTIYNRSNYSQSEFTILHSVVNLVPFYCLIASLAFITVIKLGRIVRNDHMRNMISPMSQSNIQEVCFKNLKNAWDRPN
ncbi:hypothetical protein PRIPAC_96619, partial [Pristionchus pacificus]|uniref:G protein-coupled receptor n=1 Tax=Pristionchus pacificus TaxID=54126 RepID=A0A2A6D1M9_PRIPA